MDYRILVVDDEHSMREFLQILLEREGYRVETVATAEQGMLSFEKDPHDLVLTDLNLPGMTGMDLLRSIKTRAARGAKGVPIILITAFGTAESAVEAMKMGAFDYVMKPFNNDELKMLVRRALERRRLEEENLRLKAELQGHYALGNLVGSSPAMQEVYSLIRRVRDTPINCLICGESGTGKELVVRAIHYGGTRSSGPFVAVNCGAIPENLIESELFGYCKGAFTGANKDKMGLFEAASTGTLFLDEIGEMPLMTQVKTLRAIQERRVTPVGGVEERKVDVRILAATNKDLAQAVATGRFREDLYYRLNVVTIEVPPLRERGDDILELAGVFLKQYAGEYGKTVTGFTPDTARIIASYDFPGNVRELQNLVERAVALAQGPRITPAELPESIRKVSSLVSLRTEPPDFPEEGIDLDRTMDDFERRWLGLAMERAGGNKTRAAELLGMSFRSLRYRLKKHGMA